MDKLSTYTQEANDPGEPLLDEDPFSVPEESYPSLSVVISTYNCAHLIGPTIESLVNQHYPSMELIVVDSGSSDSTLDIIHSSYKGPLKIDTVISCDNYISFNRGIALAEGDYLMFLLPGDRFLSHKCLPALGRIAAANHFPDLVYGAALVHDSVKEPVYYYRKLSFDLLKEGKYPTSLRSCFFKTSVMVDIGKFDPSFKYRSGLDLFCRLFRKRLLTKGDAAVASTDRVIIDFDVPTRSPLEVAQDSWETLRVIYKNFGFKRAIICWVKKNPLKFISHWLLTLKDAFYK